MTINMKRVFLTIFCFGASTALVAEVLEQNGIKIDITDKGKTPEDVLVYTSNARAVPVSELLALGIRPVYVEITNTSDQAIMINARSVNVPLLSPIKAINRMQRINSWTAYPYWESWGVYGAGSILATLLNFPGQWISIPKTNFTMPQSPSFLNTVGTALESLGHKLLGTRSPLVRAWSNYVKNLWGTPRSLKLVSVIGFIMSSWYLGKIHFKNKRAEEIVNSLGGQLRLYYPVLIAPGQVVNKVLLLNERDKQIPTLSFKIFAKNNQDEVTVFTYALDAH